MQFHINFNYFLHQGQNNIPTTQTTFYQNEEKKTILLIENWIKNAFIHIGVG